MLSSMMWGVVLLLLGISLIINAVFGVSLPVFRIVAGGVLIYVGIAVLLGRGDDRGPAFTLHVRKDVVGYSYATNFASRTIDLTKVRPADAKKPIVINTSFGATTIKLDKRKTTKLKVQVAFGSVELPDESRGGISLNFTRIFGDASDKPDITVDARVAFGKLEVELD